MNYQPHQVSERGRAFLSHSLRNQFFFCLDGKRGRTSPLVSDRKLRSYSKRTQRQRPKVHSNYRDQNKNVVSDLNIFR